MPTYILKDFFADDVSHIMVLNSTLTKVMQTFTTSEAYTLARIGIWIGRDPYPGDISGGIYSVSGGLPNVLLESFTITVTGWLNPGQELFALLDSPLELSSGVQYAIVLDWPGSGIQGYLHGVRDLETDRYVGGESLSYRVSSGEWENPSGTGFVDMYFKTYSSYSLTPIPGHTATGIKLYPTLSWAVD